MNEGEAEDRGERHDRARREDQGEARQRDGEERRHVAGGRHEPAQVVGRAEGAGRDRAGEACHERRPARQERRERAVPFPQVDVFPARPRAHRAQFGVRQRAGEREQAAGEPHGEKPDRVGHGLCDDLRRDEDADANHVRDDDGGGVDRAQAAIELLRSGRLLWHVGIITGGSQRSCVHCRRLVDGGIHGARRLYARRRPSAGRVPAGAPGDGGRTDRGARRQRSASARRHAGGAAPRVRAGRGPRRRLPRLAPAHRVRPDDLAALHRGADDGAGAAVTERPGAGGRHGVGVPGRGDLAPGGARLQRGTRRPAGAVGLGRRCGASVTAT